MVMPLAKASSRACVTGRPLVVGSVSRDVDHLPHGLALPLRQEADAEVDGPRDRRAGTPTDEPAGKPVGEAHSLLGCFDLGPGHDDMLDRGVGPFHVGDCHPAQHADADRLVDERRAEGLDKALTLKLLLLRIHRVGDVNRETSARSTSRVLTQAWLEQSSHKREG
jgi:hypothetical protein